MAYCVGEGIASLPAEPWHIVDKSRGQGSPYEWKPASLATVPDLYQFRLTSNW